MKDFLRFYVWNIVAAFLIVFLFFLFLDSVNVDSNKDSTQNHKQDQYVLTRKVQSNVDDKVPTIVIDVKGNDSSIEKMNDEVQEITNEMWQKGYKLKSSNVTRLRPTQLVKSLTFELTSRSD